LILYDKSGMFLGMGNQELSLLGYEDIEEFKNYHNDVADLFINKPGYIFKFKNFSWIDYTLHSGTPNRRVLIKTKGGREIDSALLIHEIYLTQEVFGATTCFGVEFSNAPFKEIAASPIASVAQKVFETPTPYEEPASFLAEDAPSSFEGSFEYEEPTQAVSFTQDTVRFEEEFSTPISFDTPVPTSDFKLKFDSAILDELPPAKEVLPLPEPDTTETFDAIRTEEFKVTPSVETYVDDDHEDLRNDPTLLVASPRAKVIPLSPAEPLFDFSLSADALGLDISTLAMLIGEYVEELESKIKLIATSLDSSDHLNAKNEISKLKSVALHLHIMPLFKELEDLEMSLSGDNDEAILHNLLCVQNSISSLKDSVQ